MCYQFLTPLLKSLLLYLCISSSHRSEEWWKEESILPLLSSEVIPTSSTLTLLSTYLTLFNLTNLNKQVVPSQIVRRLRFASESENVIVRPDILGRFLDLI